MYSIEYNWSTSYKWKCGSYIELSKKHSKGHLYDIFVDICVLSIFSTAGERARVQVTCGNHIEQSSEKSAAMFLAIFFTSIFVGLFVDILICCRFTL